MPLGEASKLPPERFVSHQQLIAQLGTRVGPEAGLGSSLAHGGAARLEGGSIKGQGPARYLSAADGSGRKVGFITAVSDEFCDSCNRVRVTARGDFRACLASRTAVSLRDAVRAGKSDRELAWLIHRALGSKLAGHFFDRSDVDEHRQVGMSLVGG
jgi:cyclic pyranopterin phosphate synthase